jgi:hypothetical protein
MIRKGIKLTRLTVLAIALLAASLYAASPMTPFDITAQNVTNVRIGDAVVVAVDLLSGSESFASYKFLVEFDATRLTFVNAQLGNSPATCNWESFNYTLLPCTVCDRRLVEITAVADIANGNVHPSCLSQYGQLLKLNFNVTTDTLMAGSTAPVSFYWNDCTSNTLGSAAADTIWHTRFIYDNQGNNITGIDPNRGGTLPGCIAPGPTVAVRGANYHNGSVAIKSTWGLFGDVNGDGKFNLSDITYLVAYIFADGPAPKDYLHGNYDAQGGVTINDVVWLLNYLFGKIPH